MKYKIIINVPNERTTTEISITQEQLDKIELQLNSKKIIKIDNGYYNTAYIVKIIPDIDANRLESHSFTQIGEISRTMQNEKNSEAMNKIRNNLKTKGFNL